MVGEQSSSDVKKYINKKKKKKKRKKIAMISTILIMAIIIFATNAPMFNIKQIEYSGVSKISGDTLKDQLNSFIGKNIFTVDLNEMRTVLLQNKYIKDLEIKRKGTSMIQVSIVEEAPVFYIEDSNGFKIINDELTIVELVSDVEAIKSRNLVKILGLDSNNLLVGDTIQVDKVYSSVLKKFYPYIAENKEALKFDYIDITDIVQIKGKMGNVDILLGDDSNLHEKMENIYRIMLSDEIKLEKGYIDVSYDGPPVIKKID